MKNKALTEKQQAILDFMRRYFKRNDQLPCIQAIANEFGYQSPNAAYEARKVLVKKGKIEPNEAGKYRFKKRGRR